MRCWISSALITAFGLGYLQRDLEVQRESTRAVGAAATDYRNEMATVRDVIEATDEAGDFTRA